MAGYRVNPYGKPQNPEKDKFYTNKEGKTARGGMPSSSRELATTKPQKGGLPANPKPKALPPPEPKGKTDFYSNSRGETARGFQPSASREVAPVQGQKSGLPATTGGQANSGQANSGQSSAGTRNPSAAASTRDANLGAQAKTRAKADSMAYQAEQQRADDLRRANSQPIDRSQETGKKTDTKKTKPATQTKPTTKMGKLKSGTGRLLKFGGLASGALAAQDMYENGITAENAAGLGMGLGSIDPVRASATNLLTRGANVAARAAPAVAVGASAYGGLKYGEHLNEKVDDGEELNPAEAAVTWAGKRLGEGYAKYAPEWAGGMSEETAKHAPEMTQWDDLRNGSLKVEGKADTEGQPEPQQEPQQEPQLEPQQEQGSVGTLKPMPEQQVLPEPQQNIPNNVTRDGNSFSGGVVGQGFTVNGKPFEESVNTIPSTGRTPGNQQAVENLIARTPEFGQGPAAGFQPQQGRDNRPNFYIGKDSSVDDRVERAMLRSAMTPMEGAQNGQLTASQRQTMKDHLNNKRVDQRQRDIQESRNSAMLDQTQMSQQGQNQRTGARLALDERRLSGEEEARGFTIRNAKRLEQLREQYQATEDPAQRGEIAKQLEILRGEGSSTADRKPYKIQMMEQPVDPNDPTKGTRQIPLVFDPNSGDIRRAAEGEDTPQVNQNHVQALLNNPGSAEQFDAHYGVPGLSQMYLGGN